MWCSAAVDILFLFDGSHSVGKGGFERSKHFAITVCDALDISPGRVSANTRCPVSLVSRDRNSAGSRRKTPLSVGCGGLRGKWKRGGIDAGNLGISQGS